MLRIAIVGGAIAAAAAIFIPGVMGAASDPLSAQALGEGEALSAIGAAPVASPPPGLRVLATETGEADLASTRILGAARDQAFYGLDSLKSADRMCLAATGAVVGLWCGPRAAAGTGKLIIRQPTVSGVRDAPAVYFGLVPDGVVSVESDGRLAAVAGNVFSIYRESGEALGRLTYTTADGGTVGVDPTSPG